MEFHAATEATRLRPAPIAVSDANTNGALIGVLATCAPVAMVLVDAAGEVKLVTEVARAMWQADRSAASVPPGGPATVGDPTFAAAVAAAFADGVPAIAEISVAPVLPGAAPKRFRRRIEPCRASDGEIVGACVTYFEDDRAQIAHDLRSPLTAIAMWAKFMRTRPMSEAERAQGLDTISHSVEMQQRLLDAFAGR